MAEETTPATTAKTATSAPVRKKQQRAVSIGQVHILASFNNTIITFTDPKGSVLTWASAGQAGFRGSRKGTAYAAQVASVKAAEAVRAYGLQKVDAFVKGIGLGRDAAIRALQGTDIFVSSITDVTGAPHNGCRPKRARRV